MIVTAEIRHRSVIQAHGELSGSKAGVEEMWG
jgi:hypothetical protein